MLFIEIPFMCRIEQVCGGQEFDAMFARAGGNLDPDHEPSQVPWVVSSHHSPMPDLNSPWESGFFLDLRRGADGRIHFLQSARQGFIICKAKKGVSYTSGW